MDDKELDLLIALEGADMHWLSQLVAFRKIRGLTQGDVARKMGLTQSRISQLENINSGKRRQHSDILTRYAEAIGAYTGHVVIDGEDESYKEFEELLERRLRELHRKVRDEEDSRNLSVDAATNTHKFVVRQTSTTDMSSWISTHWPLANEHSAASAETFERVHSEGRAVTSVNWSSTTETGHRHGTALR